MKNYYLKSTDKETLYSALESANIVEKFYDPEDENNIRPENLDLEAEWSPSGEFNWITKEGYSLDEIGTIYKQSTNMVTNENGDEFPELVAQDGYHANLLANLTDEQIALLPVIDAPSTPYRVWAGLN